MNSLLNRSGSAVAAALDGRVVAAVMLTVVAALGEALGAVMREPLPLLEEQPVGGLLERVDADPARTSRATWALEL